MILTQVVLQISEYNFSVLEDSNLETFNSIRTKFWRASEEI
jgi:hypothetical protein